jgi:two-component system phosphate regulon sensor histidine kinase PhoR
MSTVRAGFLEGSDDSARGIRRIIELVIWLVIVPTAALLAVGVLMMVFWQARLNILFGILVVTLVGCLTTGAVLALVMLRREAALSKLQLDFVSKVSHELRTPLTSIRMFVEMLRTGRRTEHETELCLDVLEKETSRLSDRIERLLDWGRMEAGRKVFELRTEAVETVVTEAVEAFAGVTAEDDEIEVTVNPSLPSIRADRGALVDVLLNLMANAHKYSRPPRRIEITASADDRTVRIAVADNGIGIPRAEHRRIFQKFYRVDERLSRERNGSGLGLAIVRHVVKGHGGRIEVDSTPGCGSTFTVILPHGPVVEGA